MTGLAAPIALGGEVIVSDECEEVRNKNNGAAIRMTTAMAISPLIISDDNSRCDSLGSCSP